MTLLSLLFIPTFWAIHTKYSQKNRKSRHCYRVHQEMADWQPCNRPSGCKFLFSEVLCMNLFRQFTLIIFLTLPSSFQAQSFLSPTQSGASSGTPAGGQ